MSTDTRNQRAANGRQTIGRVAGDGCSEHRQLSFSDFEPECPGGSRPLSLRERERATRGSRRHAMRLAARQISLMFGQGSAANDNTELVIAERQVLTQRAQGDDEDGQK